MRGEAGPFRWQRRHRSGRERTLRSPLPPDGEAGCLARRAEGHSMNMRNRKARKDRPRQPPIAGRRPRCLEARRSTAARFGTSDLHAWPKPATLASSCRLRILTAAAWRGRTIKGQGRAGAPPNRLPILGSTGQRLHLGRMAPGGLMRDPERPSESERGPASNASTTGRGPP